MNAKPILALLTLASSWFLAAPQRSDDERQLRPVPRPMDLAEEWARDLRAPDLDTRRAAYGEALAGAVRSPGVREAIEEWTRGDDVELAWTAELLLRELDRGPGAGPYAGRPDGRWHHGLPRDPFGWHGLDTGNPEELFRRLDRLFDEPLGGFLFEDWPHGRGGPFRGFPVPSPHDPHGLSESSSEGLSLETGPDGVRVEVRETENGNEKVRTYEAESLEALLEEHPELEERIGAWRVGPDGARGLLRRPFLDRGRPPFSLEPSEMRTDRLGVQVTVPQAGADAEAQGLRVMRVLPHGLGDALGLEVGETLLEINGVPIHGVEDVTRTLAERAEDEAVEVKALGADGREKLHRWEPGARLGRDDRVY